MHVNDMTTVFWRGGSGKTFQLSGSHDFQGVVLRNVSGLVSEVSRTLRGRSSGVGGDVSGQIVEVMPGTLEVEILPTETQTLPEVWEEWKRSWSTDERRQGTLEILTRAGRWTVPAILERNIATPNPGPSSPGLAQFTSSVSVLALDGIWSGRTRTKKGEGILKVSNSGTVDLHPEIVWSGAGQSVTFPGGREIMLPTVVGEHRMTLNPGDGFKVWGPDGREATDVWAGFRGVDMRSSIAPGEIREFMCSSNASLVTTPLHENPWG